MRNYSNESEIVPKIDQLFICQSLHCKDYIDFIDLILQINYRKITVTLSDKNNIQDPVI